MEQFLTDSDLWLIGVVIIIAFAAATECGYRAHQWWQRRNLRTEKNEGASHILGGALGLLALILGFSFSIALDRFDARRDMVVKEANAIGTAYLRAQLLGEPLRTEMSLLLTQYLDARVAYARGIEDMARLVHDSDPSEALRDQVWEATERALKPIMQFPISSQILESINAVIDVAAERKAVFGAHIPASVMEMVIFYALISMGILGYVLFDTGRRHVVASTLLVLLVAIVITLILDIDRPRRGSVTISLAPLTELQEKLTSSAQAALPTDFSYDCDGGKTFRVVFSPNFGAVELHLGDVAHNLAHTRSASGARYEGNDYVYWSKGRDAFVEHKGEVVLGNCKQK